MDDCGLEQLVHFTTRERNTLDLIINSLPAPFVDIHSPGRLSDHDIVSGTLKVVIPPFEKPKKKVYRYQKGDYESMRKDTLKFAKQKYFNGHLDTRSVQDKLQSIVQFIFYFWSFEISRNIPRNQKKNIGLDSYILNSFSYLSPI